MKNFKKILALALAAVLLVGATFAATVAWMTAEVDEKKNVFTVGDIDIDLKEETGIDGEGGTVNQTTDGAEYIGVMPGDHLIKEVSISNTGDVPAYVALTVNVNNAALIAAAIEGYTPAYTASQIQGIYDLVFENWGMIYDGALSNGLPTNTELLKVDTQVANDQWNLTYYLHLDPNETFVPFTGLNAPAIFDNAQMEMFQGLTILVDAAAIQADNFATSDEAFAALAGQTAPVIPEVVVSTAAELQAALNAGKTAIVLGADIEGNVAVPMAPGREIAIDGDGKTFAGVILVDGKSGTYTDSALTIQNVNFKADAISADACIQLGKDNNTRYTCNVSVVGCTFDVPGAVGIKSYTGGDKNLTVTNCTATARSHSLIQAKGVDGIKIESCKVYSENGMNFNNSDNVTVIDCTVNTQGYCVRFGESKGGVGAAETYSITGCSLTSACVDGDAVIVLRGTADYATLTLEDNTLTGTAQITNTATGAVVIEN